MLDSVRRYPDQCHPNERKTVSSAVELGLTVAFGAVASGVIVLAVSPVHMGTENDSVTRSLIEEHRMDESEISSIAELWENNVDAIGKVLQSIVVPVTANEGM